MENLIDTLSQYECIAIPVAYAEMMIELCNKRPQPESLPLPIKKICIDEFYVDVFVTPLIEGEEEKVISLVLNTTTLDRENITIHMVIVIVIVIVIEIN